MKIKKSNLPDILWIMAILFGASIVLIIMYHVWGQVQEPLNAAISSAVPANETLNVTKINDNVRKISIIISSFSILLFVISLSLINNTIRLSVYSKRFLIHTMQLVGATRGFIRWPFILKGAWNGMISALIAACLLTGSIYIAQKQVSDIIELVDPDIMGLLFLFMIILGVFISAASTFFAVNKYLNLEKDKLYY